MQKKLGHCFTGRTTLRREMLQEMSRSRSFLEFCTEGYMSLLSRHNLDMDNLADTPDVEDKVACLHYISSKVIDKVFLSISSVVQDIIKAGERAQK